MARIRYSTEGPGGGTNGTGVYAVTGVAGTIALSPQPATRWPLARQSVALLDDDTASSELNPKTVYLNTMPTARSIFYNTTVNPGSWGNSREIRNGRMDAAASTLDDIRRYVTVVNPLTGALRPWNLPASDPALDQREIISSALYYPRAERRAPSMNRVDQALTNHVIGSACSSFMVDWTYYNGVGNFDTNEDGIIDPFGGLDLAGIVIPPSVEQLWFGMPQCEIDPTSSCTTVGPPASLVCPDSRRGTRPLSANLDYPMANWINQMNPTSIYFYNIEGNNPATSSPVFIDQNSGGLPTVMHYEAFFGYNQTRPYWNDSATPPFASSTPYLANVGSPARQAAGYTPWPSAIRVTMTLHDPDGRLEGGRDFQFVIDLPKRAH
jgi:hypothetical protein